MDAAQLWEECTTALYLAEAEAERVPHPDLLSALLLAKGAVSELYKRAGAPLTD
jgi:hypothetical protein